MEENKIYLRELFTIIKQNFRKIMLIALAFFGFCRFLSPDLHRQYMNQKR